MECTSALRENSPERALIPLRVDLAGLGDSCPRPGLTIQQSVAADFEEILSVLEAQLGTVSIVLVGLCSGADNAIGIAPSDPRIVGMVLLDPVCDPDIGFRARAFGFAARIFARKCMTPLKILAVAEAPHWGSDEARS